MSAANASMTLDEIKQSANDTLQIFRDFCIMHHLRYYLIFGTLLGAVRHHGFIPWDDDIDVGMPREDYDYLLAHFNDAPHNHRKIIYKGNTPGFYLDLAKIIDCRTMVQEEDRPIHVGVWIDIFPLEHLPAGKIQSRIFLFLINGFDFIYRLSAKTTYHPGRRPFFRALAHFIHFFLPSKELLLKLRPQFIAAIPCKKFSQKYYCLLHRIYWNRSVPVVPIAWLEPSTQLEFEGNFYNAPGQYDAILRGCYGDDYMSLPPRDQQISRHLFSTRIWNE